MGTKWIKVLSDPFIHIDAGPFGIVYAVTAKGALFARWGITKDNPQGVGWDRVPPAIAFEGQRPTITRSVSCGSFGCWATDQSGLVSFRRDVTPQRTRGN